jgi:tetratricopeptide (TPR) repeat protein
MFKDSSRNPTFFLLSVLALTFWIYFPGLQGGFLFDDFPNLKELGTYGGVVDFNSLRAFVLSGFSGPTGRPLSLLSFLLNDNTWPSQAYSFKLTNLWIHLLTGLLLCWATMQLLRLYGLDERRAIWVAVLSSSIWLLHPYFVSTTLYVVQRMAQLAALFMFAGIAGYLRGRLLLGSRPRAAYIWMTLSVGLGTLLAVLSKENGALLPLLIVVIDFCQPKSSAQTPARLWRAVVIWLPALVVVGALARMINFSPDLWPVRPFNQPERLLSEARIMWEYLFHLFVPQIEARGLFQDGYDISRSWFSPTSSFFAVIGLVVLLASGVLLRKRWPLYGLAVLFFFASHLMESSVVGLELYFEHRNYVAAGFLFLPVAAVLVLIAEKTEPKISMTVITAVFAVLMFMTWQRASLWSDTEKLQIYWAVSTPESPRAQNAIAAALLKQGRVAEANALLEKATVLLPDSALLTIRLLLQKVYTDTATRADFALASKKLATQPFDAQAIAGLRTLTDFAIKSTAKPLYKSYAIELVDVMSSNANYQRISVFQRMAPYLKAQLFLAQGLPDESFAEYLKAIDLYADTEASLMMVAELARAGYQELALQLLPRAKTIYDNQSRSRLRRTPAEYDLEFSQLERDLHEDIARRKATGGASE